jgi:CelD/BcsL family acetyltransferase involved in cellulose biosynthesis
MNDLPLRNALVASAQSFASPEIEVVASKAGFMALRREWEELFERAAEPHQVFQSFEFLEMWGRHYLKDDARLHILVARESGRIEAIVPLMRRRRLGLDMLCLMGTPVAQFDDVIVAPDVSDGLSHALWQAIETSGADLLELRRVRADSALCRLLPATSLVVERTEAPVADLARRVAGDGPGDAYSARDRSSFRRRMRRLAELGEVSCSAVPAGGEAARLAANAIDMKRAWLRANGLLSPTVKDPRFRAFFIDAAARLSSSLRISAIEVDGRPVAIDLSFDCKGRTFGHVIATDAGYEREGIGQLLIYHVLAMAKARGNTAFELMAPFDDYKRRHADGLVPVESLIVPFSARGRLAAGTVFSRVLPAAKSLIRRLPVGLKRLLV